MWSGAAGAGTLPGMEIKLTVDIPEFSRQAESYVTRRFAPALQEVADYLGASARQRLMTKTTRRFSDPVAWTINAFAYRRAGTPDSPGSYVYVLERQARYLGLEVTGGPRVGGDYATTAGGPLVPASGARGISTRRATCRATSSVTPSRPGHAGPSSRPASPRLWSCPAAAPCRSSRSSPGRSTTRRASPSRTSCVTPSWRRRRPPSPSKWRDVS